MNNELKELIKHALTDGVITSKERKVIYGKADSLGISRDEIDVILESELHKISIEKKNESKELGKNKCPNCGDIINGLDRICPSCNFVIERDNSGIDIHEMTRNVEHLIASLNSESLKSPEKNKNFSSGLKNFRNALLGKEVIIQKTYEDILSESESELRRLNLYYGDDKKVQNLTQVLSSEIKKSKKQYKRKKFANETLPVIYIIGFFIFFIGALIIAKKFEISSEVKTAVGQHQFQQAYELSKDSKDRDFIAKAEVNYYIGIGDFKKARLKALTIDDSNARDEFLKKIDLEK